MQDQNVDVSAWLANHGLTDYDLVERNEP